MTRFELDLKVKELGPLMLYKNAIFSLKVYEKNALSQCFLKKFYYIIANVILNICSYKF